MPHTANRPNPGPEGVAWFLRCPLTGHRSKNHDKGGYGINIPVLGTNAAVKKERKVGSVIDRSELHRGE
jgi:hypothetical protein